MNSFTVRPNVMNHQLFLAILFLFLFGCHEAELKGCSNKSNIPVTDGLLIREWMLDSISGSDRFLQDWIYFTPDHKFWRFSYYNNSYIIDSALDCNGDKIFLRDQLKYTIYSPDSNHLLLVTPEDSVFHLKSRRHFDIEDIARFVRANPHKLLLNGNWKMDSADYSPSYLPSYCENLYPGSRLVFNGNGFLDVYPRDSTHKCYSYSYKVSEEEISIVESDMTLNLALVKISGDTLILKSRWLHYQNPDAQKVRESAYNIYLSRVKRSG